MDMKKRFGLCVLVTVMYVALLVVSAQVAFASRCHNCNNDRGHTGASCPTITWMKCCITFPASCGEEPTITCEPVGDECVSSCSEGQFCWCMPSW